MEKPEPKSIIRLCHLCNTLNEQDTEILRCGTCGKGFLPMHYFERLRLRSHSSGGNKETLAVAERVLASDLVPVQGLIVIW